MTTVAVLAHAGKSLGGGLGELRSVLADEGVTDPIWYEVPKSKRAPKQARRVVEEGADLVFVWGGDGMVQRCVDALADTKATVAIIPAGHRQPPRDEPRDSQGHRRGGAHRAARTPPRSSTSAKGQRRAVRGHGRCRIRRPHDPRRRSGHEGPHGSPRLHLHGREEPLAAAGSEPGSTSRASKWFDDEASCVLFGNIGTILGGIEAFEHASPDDGRLEVGVVTADGMMQWMRTLGRTALEQGGEISVRPHDEREAYRRQVRRDDAVRARRWRPRCGQADEGPRANRRRSVSASPTSHDHGTRHEQRVMSTATPVPETWDLSGDDARETLLHTGRRQLIARRLPTAASRPTVSATPVRSRSRRRSCSSKRSSRSSGLAVALGNNEASDLIVRTLKAAAPGPAGDLLTCDRGPGADQTALSERYAALWLGLVGADRHRHDTHGPVRASAEPALRHREGPALVAEVRPRPRPRA